MQHKDLILREKYQGYWEIKPRIAIKDSYSLSLVYTPGVGRVSTEVAENPEKSFELTNRANSVAVISDNSVTGALSKIPMLEMKAVYYNNFAGIDAYPLSLDTFDAKEIAEIIINLAPTFGGFVLTGLSREKESEIIELLNKEEFNLPVLYDSACKSIYEETLLRLIQTSDREILSYEKSVALVLRAVLDTRACKLSENVINKLQKEIWVDSEDSKIVYNLVNAIIEENNSQISVSPEDIQQKFIDFLAEGKKAWLEKPAPPDILEKLSLAEKSVELHKRSKGAIETSCKVNPDNIYDDSEETAEEISRNPEYIYESTPKGNLTAVISDGSAVLGLGNIGAEGAIPVMEGKASLFKTLGGIDAIPICLKTQDTEELIRIISKISPVLGGINLEDISAPRCFEIEKALIEKLDIPVFHDDQHGTAVVVLAGFINALKLTGKKAEKIKVVINGAGAGATAVSKLLMSYGVKNLILCDRTGAIFDGRQEGMNPFKQEMAEITNPNKEKGLLKDVITNADFFIGLSSANVVSREMIKSMAKKAVVFALANPVPEIMPEDALEAGAFIVATGRSDFKNQVNNSLAFPGIFRGALDVRAQKITDEMKISAAWAIANLIQENELNPEYIIPHALDLRVPPAVAKAVAETAIKTKIARINVNPDLIFERTRNYFFEGFLRKL